MCAFETGAGCGAGAGCCELAVRVVETGCRCRVLVAGAGCGARAGCCAGAGLLVLVVCVVEIGCRCRMLVLAVRVVETRHAVLRRYFPGKKVPVCALELLPMQRAVQILFACFCYLGSMLVYCLKPVL